LKPERWGSLLVQEKYQEEKACDKRHPYRIIIIIIMMMMMITIIIIIIIIIMIIITNND
jgi:type IV secretory pathway component VirB8